MTGGKTKKGNKMKDIMLDIETMGTGDNAAIMSIGACYFDPLTGEVGKTFHEQVSLESCVALGMEIDASTVIWWMGQSDEARSKFYSNSKAKSCQRVIAELRCFIDVSAKVWGNGIGFDNVKVNNLTRLTGHEPLWEFWNDRDVRTIVDLGKLIGADPKRDMPFDGVKHDALADAIHQAKYTSMIIQNLIKS